MNPSRLVAMNTDALMLTSGSLRSFCLLKTAKIDVFTNPSQVKPVDGDTRPLVFGDHSDVGRIVEVAAEHDIEITAPIARRSRE
jgi:hypothetical protein